MANFDDLLAGFERESQKNRAEGGASDQLQRQQERSQGGRSPSMGSAPMPYGGAPGAQGGMDPLVMIFAQQAMRDKQELETRALCDVMQQTGLTDHYARLCLDAAAGDPGKALALFAKKRGTLPPEAFRPSSGQGATPPQRQAGHSLAGAAPLRNQGAMQEDEFGAFASSGKRSDVPPPRPQQQQQPGSLPQEDEFGAFASSGKRSDMHQPQSRPQQQQQQHLPVSLPLGDDFGAFASSGKRSDMHQPQSRPQQQQQQQQQQQHQLGSSAQEDEFGAFASSGKSGTRHGFAGGGTSAPLAPAVSKEDEGSFSSGKRASAPAAPAASTKNEDDFGLFSSDKRTSAPIAPASKEDEGDFGSFSSGKRASPPAAPAASTKNEDDFGLFSSGKRTSAPIAPASKEDEDGFGSFSSGKRASAPAAGSAPKAGGDAFAAFPPRPAAEAAKQAVPGGLPSGARRPEPHPSTAQRGRSRVGRADDVLGAIFSEEKAAGARKPTPPHQHGGDLFGTFPSPETQKQGASSLGTFPSPETQRQGVGARPSPRAEMQTQPGGGPVPAFAPSSPPVSAGGAHDRASGAGPTPPTRGQATAADDEFGAFSQPQGTPPPRSGRESGTGGPGNGGQGPRPTDAFDPFAPLSSTRADAPVAGGARAGNLLGAGGPDDDFGEFASSGPARQKSQASPRLWNGAIPQDPNPPSGAPLAPAREDAAVVGSDDEFGEFASSGPARRVDPPMKSQPFGLSNGAVPQDPTTPSGAPLASAAVGSDDEFGEFASSGPARRAGGGGAGASQKSQALDTGAFPQDPAPGSGAPLASACSDDEFGDFASSGPARRVDPSVKSQPFGLSNGAFPQDPAPPSVATQGCASRVNDASGAVSRAMEANSPSLASQDPRAAGPLSVASQQPNADAEASNNATHHRDDDLGTGSMSSVRMWPGTEARAATPPSSVTSRREKELPNDGFADVSSSLRRDYARATEALDANSPSLVSQDPRAAGPLSVASQQPNADAEVSDNATHHRDTFSMSSVRMQPDNEARAATPPSSVASRREREPPNDGLADVSSSLRRDYAPATEALGANSPSLASQDARAAAAPLSVASPQPDGGDDNDDDLLNRSADDDFGDLPAAARARRAEAGQRSPASLVSQGRPDNCLGAGHDEFAEFGLSSDRVRSDAQNAARSPASQVSQRLPDNCPDEGPDEFAEFALSSDRVRSNSNARNAARSPVSLVSHDARGPPASMASPQPDNCLGAGPDEFAAFALSSDRVRQNAQNTARSPGSQVSHGQPDTCPDEGPDEFAEFASSSDRVRQNAQNTARSPVSLVAGPPASTASPQPDAFQRRAADGGCFSLPAADGGSDDDFGDFASSRKVEATRGRSRLPADFSMSCKAAGPQGGDGFGNFAPSTRPREPSPVLQNDDFSNFASSTRPHESSPVPENDDFSNFASSTRPHKPGPVLENDDFSNFASPARPHESRPVPGSDDFSSFASPTRPHKPRPAPADDAFAAFAPAPPGGAAPKGGAAASGTLDDLFASFGAPAAPAGAHGSALDAIFDPFAPAEGGGAGGGGQPLTEAGAQDALEQLLPFSEKSVEFGVVLAAKAGFAGAASPIGAGARAAATALVGNPDVPVSGLFGVPLLRQLVAAHPAAARRLPCGPEDRAGLLQELAAASLLGDFATASALNRKRLAWIALINAGVLGLLASVDTRLCVGLQALSRIERHIGLLMLRAGNAQPAAMAVLCDNKVAVVQLIELARIARAALSNQPPLSGRLSRMATLVSQLASAVHVESASDPEGDEFFVECALCGVQMNQAAMEAADECPQGLAYAPAVKLLAAAQAAGTAGVVPELDDFLRD